MKFSSFAVIVTFIALSLVGCALVPILPVKLAPSQSLPALTVSFAMPGNSARAVESEVTSRIESVLARVKGVKEINSKSHNGRGHVSISLDRHSDIENVRFEVSTLIRQVWNDLPAGITYPSISTRPIDEEGSRPFITLTLNASANPAEIQAFGEENLKPLLSRVPGVAKVELSGAQPMEWQICYDIDLLSSLGLTPSDIRTAIQEYYNQEFLGMALIDSDATGQWMRLSLKSAGDKTAFEPSGISVATRSGTSVTLDKIITAVRDEAAPTGYFRINGLNSIYVNISSEDDANQLKLADEIRQKLTEFELTRLPQGYMIDTAYDATESIRQELDKIYFRTGLTVLILLLFVGLVSLNFRYVLLITIGLTVNLAVAVVFYYLTGIEIQLYSLAGITISLNLIIDNLIVMADHYTRCHNRKAFTAILAATLTTVGALSVVFFMDEEIRLSLQDFVNVVIINLTVSLAVALFLVPALVDRLGLHRSLPSARFRRLRKRFSDLMARIYRAVVIFVVRFRVAFIVVIILAFGLPVFMIPVEVEGEGVAYERYNKIFGSSLYKEKIKPVSDAVLGGTLRLFVEKVYNGSYWGREPHETVLMINATLPNGSTLEQMNSMIKKMELYLSGFDEIRQFQTNISGPRRASISVYFNKENQYGAAPYKIKSDIISKALTLSGGAWSVYGLENDAGFDNDVRERSGSYRVKLTGYNYDELSDWTYRLRDSLLTNRRIKEVSVGSEFSYWKDDYTEFHLVIDRDELAQLGITVNQLFGAIEPTFGRDINCVQIAGERQAENVKLHSLQSDVYDIYALMNRPFSIGGKVIKLSDISKIEKRQAPQDIIKRNQEYEMCLQYEYIGAKKQADKASDRYVDMINSLMPVGYNAVNVKAGTRSKDESNNYWLLILVIVIIFFTTSILFNSLRQPIAIILIIPVSFIGVFATFYLLELKFDQGGFASFILLAGITVNAAIYILNEYNSLRRRHPSATELSLYLKAFGLKIVPILLTVLSTILGFIPFVIGETKESFWFPLAVGTMGGLLMSLIAVFFVLPVFILPKSKLTKSSKRCIKF
ncbi:MAG: efflux RND transporter permease subunit [Muribaculaceae bacterium]|nr:efflux RND transporter permease subunit [Muribaculaceae bacterium]